MPEEQESQELSKLQRKIYQRGASFPESRSELDPLAVDPTSKSWHQDPNEPNMSKKAGKNFSAVKFIFIVSLVFFVGAVGLTLFQYFNGLNVVSDVNIDVSIEGPEKVNAGEVLQLSVTTVNRNKEDLEDVTISVLFPSGSKEPEDPSAVLREIREPIGEIVSGYVSIKTFKGLVYGEEGQEKIVDVILEYRIAGSNGTFKKKESYAFTIGSSPVRVTASLPEEVNSGQPFTLEVEASLNANTTASDLAVAVSYPPGFTFAGSQPEPTNGKNVWSLSDLGAGETKKIRIHGLIDGQDDEVKSFRVRAGTLDEPTDQDLAIEYNSLFETVAIRRSFVLLKILVNNSDTLTVVDSDKTIPVEIEWTNTLSKEVRNGQVEVMINGQAVKESSITHRGGNYNSDTNTITWGKNDSSLSVIGPGETGKVSFSLPIESFLVGSGALLSTPTVDLQVKFTAARSSGENISTDVEVEANRALRVNTVAQLISRGLFNTGAFAPTGPMPPRVGQETLYTIEWAVLNSTNDIKESKVQAILPVGLRWVGDIMPKNENVSYDQSNRVVTWDVGNIQSGSSVGGGRREASFQIGLTPSVNQAGQTPVLLTGIKFNGIDTFTQKVLNINTTDIDIRLIKDPLFKPTADSKVVQ